MEFVGKRQPLTSSGLGNALEQIGLQPAEAAVIWAVVDVETSGVTQGCGFRLDGRPQILFERHVFRRETQGRFNAQAPHLSGPAGGYGGLGTQYAKLEEALALCLALGFSPGKIDGVIGQRTRNALNSFRLKAGLPPGGDLDGPCYVALCQKAGLLP